MNQDMVDPDMLDAFDVFKVGIRFDGLPVLSRDGRMPIDETVVWMVDAPGEETTVGELSKLTDFEWVAEPQVWVPPKSMQAATDMVVDPALDVVVDVAVDPAVDTAVDPLAGMPMPGTPAFDQVQDAVQLNDVEQIEIVQAIESAEDRIGQLEGLIAQSLLSTVTDHMFDGETAVVASAAFVASIGDSNSDEIFARLAALPKDLPVDLMTRVDDVIERLTAIEEQVSKMMLDDVSDEELPQGSGSDFVDETVVNVDDPMGKKKLKP